MLAVSSFIPHRFPYPDKDPKAYAALLETLYTLVWEDEESTTPIGYVLESVFNKLAKVPIKVKGELEVNRRKRTISAFQLDKEVDRSKAVAATTAYWRVNKTFEILSGWRDELYPVYGPRNELLYRVERSASTLFASVIPSFMRTKTLTISGGCHVWCPHDRFCS